jgi:mono/diheme cytochrome c family protein
MHSKTVRCAAAVLLVLGGTFATPPAQADASLFKEHCAKCHARAAAVARGLKGQSAVEKSSQLDVFLKTHYAEDAQLRAKIVAYLVALSGK